MLCFGVYGVYGVGIIIIVNGIVNCYKYIEIFENNV